MSQNPKFPDKVVDLPYGLLIFPFATMEAVGAKIMATFTNKSKAQPKPLHEVSHGVSLPNVTKNLQYQVADRVYSREINGRKVSFYHYYTADVIRIVCRELRHIKPIDFTPLIADDSAVVFDIDGAIQWVRQNGLKPVALIRTEENPKYPKKATTTLSHTPPWDNEEKQAKNKPTPVSTSPSQSTIVPATGSKSAQFTGRIVSFGTSQRTGNGDGKPYITYAMKIRSETGAYDKEFIGEHLSDLVADMKLQVGQLIRIQLLGKHYFEVEVDGKMEQRNRNHFAINII